MKKFTKKEDQEKKLKSNEEASSQDNTHTLHFEDYSLGSLSSDSENDAPDIEEMEEKDYVANESEVDEEDYPDLEDELEDNVVPKYHESLYDEQKHHPALVKNKLTEKLVDIGNDLLLKIYNSEDATFGDEKSSSNLIEKGLYKTSGLEAVADDLYAYTKGSQSNWFSLTSAVKSINRSYFNSQADNEYADSRRDYLAGVVAVMWALYNQAANQGDDFERGSYKAVDPHGKLFAFLKGYVCYATKMKEPNEGYTGLKGNSFAYGRNDIILGASHYKGKKYESDLYGIDGRDKGGNEPMGLFPTKEGEKFKTHTLLGQVNIDGKKLLFVKFEPAGLGNGAEILLHGLELLGSHKKDESYKGEKLAPTPLKKAYNDYIAATEKDIAKTEEVSEMHKVIEEALRSEPKDSSAYKAAKAFNKAVKKLGMEDNVAIRTGRESILDLSYLDTLNKPISSSSKKMKLK